MRKAKELVGTPVLALSTGETIGHVSEAVFDPGSRQLLGLIVSDDTQRELVVKPESIQAFGADAVTLRRDAGMLDPASAPEVAAGRHESGHLYGLRVTTDGGKILGTVEDILYDNETGRLGGFEISDGLIQDFVEGRVSVPVPDEFTAGPDALVVPAMMEEEIKSLRSRVNRID